MKSGSLVMLLFFLACGGVTYVSPLPSERVPNTRNISAVSWDSTVVVEALTQLEKASPNEELVCLYGRVVEDSVIEVTEIRDAITAGSTPQKVLLTEKVPSGCVAERNYLGTLHSHLVTSSGLLLRWRGQPPCRASIDDLRVFSADRNAALLGVFCSNGWAYVQLRDGKVQIFKWSK